MDVWHIQLINSESLKIKTKKKDLLKKDKTYLTCKRIVEEKEDELFINRDCILWFRKEEADSDAE
ncbi:MAG: hypothetical protein FD122_526 [Stygiobacter sp.]|nr:MAG: hypothetical protein FD122_526 [Stygiobacter sp.]KAF0210818.1 MAG: hypothetical protein FD178_3566 [Ignavibacteria bacterium]